MNLAQIISLVIIIVGALSATSSALAVWKFWDKRDTPGIPYLILKMISNAIFNFATALLIAINVSIQIITGAVLADRTWEAIIFITAFVLSSIGPILFSAQLFGWVDDEWLIKFIMRALPRMKIPPG